MSEQHARTDKASQNKIITAALVVIGNEILSGRTQDTNTQFIAEALANIGVRLMEVRVVPDLFEAIAEAVNTLRQRHNYVFTTGGIGPTHDDITTQSIAKIMGRALLVHPMARRALEAYYGLENLTEARLKMAMLPEGAQLIPNPVSGAPGFSIENIYVMAGVPRIMQAMLADVLPGLKGGAKQHSITISCALGESTIAQDLAKIQNDFPDVDIGSYPQYRSGKLGLSLVLRGTDIEALDTVVEKIAVMLKKFDEEPTAISKSYESDV